MNVFIVEDEPQTRKELANLLAGEKGIEVVGSGRFGARGTRRH